jgi:hypothetical protein
MNPDATKTSLPLWARVMLATAKPDSPKPSTSSPSTSVAALLQSPCQLPSNAADTNKASSASGASSGTPTWARFVGCGRSLQSGASCLAAHVHSRGQPPDDEAEDGGEEDKDSGDEEPESEYSDEEDLSEDDSGAEEEGACQVNQKTTSSTGKLWSAKQFPEGTKGHACWDWANIKAAQAWECPCTDRRNCIGAERIRPEDLLVHRKQRQTTATVNSRDAARLSLAEHFSSLTKSFSRSFVVGHLNDCCAASAGLANGHSWASWARSRSDCTKDRPLHAGRCKLRQEQESVAARCIDAYIRDRRSVMNGSKGSSRGSAKSYTAKESMSVRYQGYRNDRISSKLPVLGSKRLFTKRWKAQEGIVELAPTGHAICDECTEIQVLRDKGQERCNDEVGRTLLREADEREEIHKGEHRGDPVCTAVYRDSV